MAGVAAVLTEARAAGLDVTAEADVLIVRGTWRHEDLARRLLAQKPAVLALLTEEDRELAWRIAAMRPQVPATGPIPFLIARDAAPMRGYCLSCGDGLPSGQTIRCALCVRAAQLVLSQVREGVEP
jgi:hypothetical protein